MGTLVPLSASQFVSFARPGDIIEWCDDFYCYQARIFHPLIDRCRLIILVEEVQYRLRREGETYETCMANYDMRLNLEQITIVMDEDVLIISDPGQERARIKLSVMPK